MLQIEWIVKPPDQGQAADCRLTVVQLDTLRDLAAIGHVSGLRTQLDVLEREAPGSGAHIAQLRGLLAEYELEAFLTALGRHRRRSRCCAMSARR